MFQVLKKDEKDEIIVYNVLQVNKNGNTILFLIEKNGKLIWMISSLFRPYITDIETMPTFTLKGTRTPHVFYAAISGRYYGYDLIYYDDEWKSIDADVCIIEGNIRID